MKKVMLVVSLILCSIGIVVSQVDTVAYATHVNPGIVDSIVDAIFSLFSVTPWWLYLVALVVIGAIYALRHFGVKMGKIVSYIVDYLQAVAERVMEKLNEEDEEEETKD